MRGACTNLFGFMNHPFEDRSDELLDVVEVDLDVAHKFNPSVIESSFHFRDCFFVPAATDPCCSAVRAIILAEDGVAGGMPLCVISTMMQVQKHKSYIMPVLTGFLCCRTPSSALTIYVHISNVRLIGHREVPMCELI
jgi:hypothetical protein